MYAEHRSITASRDVDEVVNPPYFLRILGSTTLLHIGLVLISARVIAEVL